MIRTIGIAAALLAVSSVAASARVEYQGTFFITKANQICTELGLSVGQFGLVRFRPANVGDNDGLTRFGVHFQRYSLGHFIEGKIRKKFKPMDGASVTAGFTTWNNAEIKYTELDPKPVKASVEKIAMTVVINNFGGTDGCKLTLSGAATQDPDEAAFGQ